MRNIEHDGILFSSDMKTIICYPRYKKGRCYAIPQDVDILFNGIFNNPRYLRSIIFPKPSVTIIGSNFHNMGNNLTSIYVYRAVNDKTELSFTGNPFFGTNFDKSRIQYLTPNEYLIKECKIEVCTAVCNDYIMKAMETVFIFFAYGD